MFRLEAKYDISLENGKFFINRPMAEDLCFKIKIDNFEVDLCLNPKKSRFMEPAVVAVRNIGRLLDKGYRCT